MYVLMLYYSLDVFDLFRVYYIMSRLVYLFILLYIRKHLIRFKNGFLFIIKVIQFVNI